LQKFSGDKQASDSLSADLEIQATFSGVSVSGGAKYASENLASSSAVTIMQKATRLMAPPLALPDEAPDLTDTAIRILTDYGEDTFRVSSAAGLAVANLAAVVVLLCRGCGCCCVVPIAVLRLLLCCA